MIETIFEFLEELKSKRLQQIFDHLELCGRM